jgi:FkbM family methyltransferase
MQSTSFSDDAARASTRRTEEAGANKVFERILGGTFARAARAGGHFLQIGANDGVSNDPLSRHVLESGLPGVCVEPSQSAFSRLEEHYKGHGQVRCVQAAVARKCGTARLYRAHIPPRDHSEKASRQAQYSAERKATFDRDLALKRARRYNGVDAVYAYKYIQTLHVQTYSLPALFEREEVALPAILQVDAEGHDWEILKQYPMDRHRPALINFEIDHLSRGDYDAAMQWLESWGYVLFIHGRDCCALQLKFMD